jgi:mono/diheme cytochrome c family protein
MNKRIVFLTTGLIVLAAALVVAQVVRKGDYTETNLGRVFQAVPAAQAPGPMYGVEAYPLYRPQLAPGPGRELVAAYCNTCHSPRYITMQPPLPADVWEAEVHKMINAMGASIPASDVPKIVRYLQAHYTPETRER